MSKFKKIRSGNVLKGFDKNNEDFDYEYTIINDFFNKKEDKKIYFNNINKIAISNGRDIEKYFIETIKENFDKNDYYKIPFILFDIDNDNIKSLRDNINRKLEEKNFFTDKDNKKFSLLDLTESTEMLFFQDNEILQSCSYNKNKIQNLSNNLKDDNQKNIINKLFTNDRVFENDKIFFKKKLKKEEKEEKEQKENKEQEEKEEREKKELENKIELEEQGKIINLINIICDNNNNDRELNNDIISLFKAILSNDSDNSFDITSIKFKKVNNNNNLYEIYYPNNNDNNKFYIEFNDNKSAFYIGTRNFNNSISVFNNNNYIGEINNRKHFKGFIIIKSDSKQNFNDKEVIYTGGNNYYMNYKKTWGSKNNFFNTINSEKEYVGCSCSKNTYENRFIEHINIIKEKNNNKELVNY